MAQDAPIKAVPASPAVVPGAGMTELARRSVQVIKSAQMLYSDTGTVNILELPGNVLLLDAFVRVTAAFDGTGTSAAATATISVPGDTGAVVFYDAGALGLNTTGFKPSTGGFPDMTPASGGMVIVTYTANTTTAGALEVYLQYVVDMDKQG